jgi:hypothetical protein
MTSLDGHERAARSARRTGDEYGKNRIRRGNSCDFAPIIESIAGADHERRPLWHHYRRIGISRSEGENLS